MASNDGSIKTKKRKRGPYGKRDIENARETSAIDQHLQPLNMTLSKDDFSSSTNSKTLEHHTEIETQHVQRIDELQDDLFVDENIYVHAPQEDQEVPGENYEENYHDLPFFDYDNVTRQEINTEDPELDEVLKELHENMEELLVEDLILDSDDEDDVPLNNDDKTDGDFTPLYDGASVTIGAFMLLLAIFTTRYGLVGDGIQHLLNIIAFALPNSHNLCTKLHQYKKFFTNLKNPLIYHYYCQHCFGKITDLESTKCPYDFCGKTFDKKRSHYFLEMPIKNQIQNLFMQEDFYEKLQHRFTRNRQDGIYKDIYDGNIYKSQFNNGGFLSDPRNISFTLNTDGASVFKSSKVSIWPIFMVINELPYKLRMKRENMILSGLWFGSQKPTMGTFLKPFQAAMHEMYNGIECDTLNNGTIITKGILLCATADLPARSLLCNHIQYNGAYSCWKCEQEGCSEKVGKGQARVFPFDNCQPKGPKRTVRNTLGHAQTAIENQNKGLRTNTVVKGIKGPSWLFFFPKFDIIHGVGVDYMHGVLLGVQKLLLELWFIQKHSSKPFSFFKKLQETDKRLLSIRPTIEITRLPRSIQNDLRHWKASEYRSFLLFYGAPVLLGILDPDRFSHFLLLVNSMHILLACGSTEFDLHTAERMLFTFCKKFEELYGTCYMRLNIHQLLHLPDCVRDLGPLYTHSCFSFEDKNGAIVKMIRGTQNIDSQIVTGVSFVQKLPELKQKCIPKGSFSERLYDSIDSSSVLKRGEQIGNGIYILGGKKLKTLAKEELDAVQEFFGYDLAQLKYNCFSRLELKDCLVYGTEYSRMIRRDNSTVEYVCRTGTKFGQVRFFMQVVEQHVTYYLAVMEQFNCPNYGHSKQILAVNKTGKVNVQQVENIISSCICVACEGSEKMYICRFPNRLESD